MVNDIKLVDLKIGIAGYADDIAINVLLKGTVQSWAANRRKSLNLSKTREMLLHCITSKPAPPPLPGIERKDCLKLLGITFHNPCVWDFHIDSLLSRAASPLYILIILYYYILIIEYGSIIISTLKTSLLHSSNL